MNGFDTQYEKSVGNISVIQKDFWFFYVAQTSDRRKLNWRGLEDMEGMQDIRDTTPNLTQSPAGGTRCS